MSAYGRVKSCYYKILGVSVRASQEEIRRSFRMLALRWHPDRNPQDPRAAERFREALEAYETLIDPSRRGQYDRSRGYGKGRARGKSAHGSAEDRAKRSYRDIVEDVFGFQFEKTIDSRSGYDLRFDLQVTRSSLGEGFYEQIDYVRSVFCKECFGNGRRSPAQSCRQCYGTGEIEEECSIRVWIPAGAENGSRLRIHGAGDWRSPGRMPGDLVVLIVIIEGH